MVEGQEDVTWVQAVALASLRGLRIGGCSGPTTTSLCRTSASGGLDAWATPGALTAVTERIRLGTLVSPATFRHPSVLAKMVVTTDHVSGGRVELGLGAGWHDQSTGRFGFPFPPTGARLEMLEEQLEIVRRSRDAGRSPSTTATISSKAATPA